MSFSGFQEKDFDVFAVDGLDERMDALKTTIRPKLEQLGEHFKEVLTEKTGEQMYYHVAKHARRKVNPPDDTWVAFCPNNRGYKKLPHFQIGLFGSHVFIWFAVIYESPVKEDLGHRFEKQLEEIYRETPSYFEWSVDHTKPDTLVHEELSKEELADMFQRLQKVKKAEILLGRTFCYSEEVLQDGPAFLEKVEQIFDELMPMYEESLALYYQSA
ncbi:YktB family protein [Alkalicoccus urumqiensis]|uniref:UPF0637 protein C6I21_12705 n=1 Tax=Alkalicoccus urumqiensis TaxID=1548213 RepID=A0A2P6MER8_ALKUR|nr:DUF1054 domain-containing protein [Alkalicoccus urumqiensis]PRO64764.1 DUF1054 domain-containing protein [Alkalicoccus urumqiensis]